MRQALQWFGVTVGFLIAALSFTAQAQTNGLSASLVLRTQAASIAEETVAHLGDSLSGHQRMDVLVEGGTVRPLIENAFLDLLGRKGVRATLAGLQADPKHLIQVTVLDQSVRYTGIASGDYRRDVQTVVEARRSFGDSTGLAYLGMFKRQDIDTVAFREEIGVLGSVPESQRTLFDRLVGPILLISGAFLIVYLFFTVRN